MRRFALVAFAVSLSAGMFAREDYENIVKMMQENSQVSVGCRRRAYLEAGFIDDVVKNLQSCTPVSESLDSGDRFSFGDIGKVSANFLYWCGYIYSKSGGRYNFFADNQMGAGESARKKFAYFEISVNGRKVVSGCGAQSGVADVPKSRLCPIEIVMFRDPAYLGVGRTLNVSYQHSSSKLQPVPLKPCDIWGKPEEEMDWQFVAPKNGDANGSPLK